MATTAVLSQDEMTAHQTLTESPRMPSSSATMPELPASAAKQSQSASSSSAAAAMELWDLIRPSPQTVPSRNNQHLQGEVSYRYTRSQVNRTLLHPKLVQPTAEDEERHLDELHRRKAETFDRRNNIYVCSECTNDTASQSRLDEGSKSLHLQSDQGTHTSKENDDDADLRARLSEALHLGSSNQNQQQLHPGQGDQDAVIQVDKNHDPTGRSNDPSPTSTLNFPDPAFAQQMHDKAVAYAEEKKAEEDVGVQVPPLQSQRRTTEIDRQSPSHTFVVCADSQIGMTSKNKEWQTELNYCRKAISKINALQPRPKFVSICGDLVDMEWTFEQKKEKTDFGSKEVCDDIQDAQNRDFKATWEHLHPDIGLVCICGNHDVGNRPTPASIQKFKSAFGDDYLAFWCNGTYNIVLNNVLFSNPTGAPQLFKEQLAWLEGRLAHARRHDAAQIYVFAHHPWFLYHEDEDTTDLTGESPMPAEWGTPPPGSPASFPDSYFSIARKYRTQALALFRRFGVDAAFTGHFHQNLLSRTEWGMDHIVTAPLSMVFESTGKSGKKKELLKDDETEGATAAAEDQTVDDDHDDNNEEEEEVNDRGVRIVTVRVDVDGGSENGFSHRFERI